MPDLLEAAQNGSQVLDNQRHERFVQLRAKGEIKTDWEAYQIAFDCSKATAEDRAYLLAKEIGINRRIKWIQAQSAGEGIASKSQVLRFLTDAMSTPVGRIDADNPLAQEVEDRPDGSRKVKGVPKLPAVELLAKLQGWLDSGRGSESTVAVQININAG